MLCFRTAPSPLKGTTTSPRIREYHLARHTKGVWSRQLPLKKHGKEQLHSLRHGDERFQCEMRSRTEMAKKNIGTLSLRSLFLVTNWFVFQTCRSLSREELLLLLYIVKRMSQPKLKEIENVTHETEKTLTVDEAGDSL